MSSDNPRSAHKKCAVVKQPTNIGDLPQDLQVRVLGTGYGWMSWKEKIAGTAAARLICKWTAACGWVPLVQFTFCRELERRGQLRETLTHSCFESILMLMKAKDSTVDQIFTAMYGPDLSMSKKTMFKGLKAWGTINDKEEKWLIKCRDHLAAGNDNLEGLEPDPDPDSIELP
jgi:hypothetical protein